MNSARWAASSSAGQFAKSSIFSFNSVGYERLGGTGDGNTGGAGIFCEVSLIFVMIAHTMNERRFWRSENRGAGLAGGVQGCNERIIQGRKERKEKKEEGQEVFPAQDSRRLGVGRSIP